MHLTPIRFVTCFLALPFGLVVGTGACGQVTGLSNDYVYDLQEDGGAAAGDASGDAATADAPKSDAPTDAPTDTADAAKCSLAQANSTQQRLNQTNGSNACKLCLATACCTDVDSCLNANECKRALSCRLDCTTMTGVDRQDCFTTCNSNSGGNTTPPAYTNGVGACSAAACSTPCAFQ